MNTSTISSILFVILLPHALISTQFSTCAFTAVSKPRTSSPLSLSSSSTKPSFSSSLNMKHPQPDTDTDTNANTDNADNADNTDNAATSTNYAANNETPASLSTSNRIQQTLDPCVVLMKELISKHAHAWEQKGGIYSLAQGVVYWEPPPQSYDALTSALQRATASVTNGNAKASEVSNDLHQYCPDEGLASLRQAILQKLQRENYLTPPSSHQQQQQQQHTTATTQVIVTSGANQAYMNCILALLSEEKKEERNEGHSKARDTCIVFKPYYFNHVMAVQMTRGEDALLVGPIDEHGMPCIKWLEQTLRTESDSSSASTSTRNIKMVTITNPGNPTGVSIPTSKLQQIVDLCETYGVWLVMDNTYEHFDHERVNCFPIDDKENGNNNDNNDEEYGFRCFQDEHVIHIFSFSKGYAMAGFRVGYVVINATGEQGKDLYQQMLKVQDTIPICTSRLSQIAALGALSAGRKWVSNKVQTLDPGRKAILQALQPLDTIIGGSGAMYVMAKLPQDDNGNHCDDLIIGEMLVEKFGIAIIPGSFCGYPGWIRVCYSNLKPEDCLVAADRLALATVNELVDKLSLHLQVTIFGTGSEEYLSAQEGETAEHELDPTKYHGRYPHSLLTLFYPYTMFRDIVLEQPINMTDIPFFWHLHHSDEKIFKQVLTKCYGLELIELNTIESIQKAIDVGLVNGLQRDTHVITSPFIRETAEVFTTDHFGRMMCFFRHPLDYDIHPAIPKYEKTDNWLTRLLTDEHEKDEVTFWELAIAKQVVRQTCLVGTLDEMKISMIRFQEHFGWKYVNGMTQELGEQCVDDALRGNLPEETWIDHESEEFKSFYKTNLMDCQLYELARSAWRHQIQTIVPWELQLSRDEDDDEDDDEEE